MPHEVCEVHGVGVTVCECDPDDRVVEITEWRYQTQEHRNRAGVARCRQVLAEVKENK